MTPAAFIAKWRHVELKERSAAQEHFLDLCRLAEHPTPAEADPAGATFCFEKGAAKQGGGEGFADVWKHGHFAFEYKGRHKDLAAAYSQLLQYREALENPPLLVVCDLGKIVVHTNFTATAKQVHEIPLESLADPRPLEILRAVFHDPAKLKPGRTSETVTADAASRFAAIADSMRHRGLDPGQTAHFLNRLVFCLFAEDIGLLPDKLFTRLATKAGRDPARFADLTGQLFAAMATGGDFGLDTIAHFNGGLFQDDSVLELTAAELAQILDAAQLDWAAIDPSILGTLFERGLDPGKRSQLGAHYTSREDIERLVEPVVMAPLRREWQEARAVIANLLASGTKQTARVPKPLTPAQQKKARGEADRILHSFLDRLQRVTVLDPACGSGNFLYVTLQKLKDLEKEVIVFGLDQGFSGFLPLVGPWQLYGIEVNPFAHDLAQTAVWIGHLQWTRANGFHVPQHPVLRPMDRNFLHMDAILTADGGHLFRSAAAEGSRLPGGRPATPLSGEEADPRKCRFISPGGPTLDAGVCEPCPDALAAAESILPKRGRAALAPALHTLAVPDWPAAEFIVGNPPFLGGKILRTELGDEYVDRLFACWKGCVAAESDLCCYWFEKARAQVETGKTRRAGLLATQGIRGGANRGILKRIKQSGDIFFAESDRSWVLDGANVHISMVGFDSGAEKQRLLDGREVSNIHSNLSTGAGDMTQARRLADKLDIAFMGSTKGGAFDIPQATALEWLHAPNPHGRPNSDVVVPWINGLDVTRRPRAMWIIDFGRDRNDAEASRYEAPFAHLQQHVLPERAKNKRDSYRRLWWQHVEARPAMFAALAGLPRFLATARVSKHRLFSWSSAPVVPDCQLIVFARADDFFFGVLHSRVHECWALAQGTQLEDRPRYTPTTCFETFPFPEAAPEQAAAIALAAKELDTLRERWLNPPEWTREEILEFPATPDGPWARFIAPGTSAARYPRHVPLDDACAAKLVKRTLTNLYNERPAWLAHAHAALDTAVLAAYGWPADIEEADLLAHLLDKNHAMASATPARPKKDTKLTITGPD